MQLRARLKRLSGVRRLWLEHNRVGGEVNGVAFVKMANGDFVSGLLDPFAAAAVQTSPDVELEVLAEPVPAQVRVVEPDPVPAETEPEAPVRSVRDAPQAPVMRNPAPRPIPPGQWPKARRK
ncbi:MAG: hypothetical protein M0Z28_27415 [Rhodospirillales bacterium]|nr:hypothetical protein [Rhodospirillales bacterium]